MIVEGKILNMKEKFNIKYLLCIISACIIGIVSSFAVCTHINNSLTDMRAELFEELVDELKEDKNDIKRIEAAFLGTFDSGYDLDFECYYGVYITRRGECYHQYFCHYLGDTPIRITLRDAKNNYYRPCLYCEPLE